MKDSEGAGQKLKKVAQDRAARCRHGTGSNATGTRRVWVTRAIGQGSGADAAGYTNVGCFFNRNNGQTGTCWEN